MDKRQPDRPLYADELFERAQKLAGTSSSAAIAANTETIYALLILQRLLAQQAADPVNNLTHIIEITNSMANLAQSIIII